MERRSRISLDNPAFRGRLRSPRNAIRRADDKAVSAGIRVAASSRHIIIRAKPAPAPWPLTTASSQPSPPYQRKQAPRGTTPASLHPHVPKQARSIVLKRQLPPKKLTNTNIPPRPPAHMPKVLTAMAVFLFIGGVFIFINSLRTDQAVKAQVKQLGNQSESHENGVTDGIPSEDDPPTNIDSYSVAPDLPKFLNIEKIGVNARIRRVGVNPDNVMKAPANIFDVGWYEGGAKPGENGTIVLDGHVAGPTKRGVFANLRSLKADDKVSLERGDGTVFHYTVVETKIYDNDQVDMPKVLTSSVEGKPALNLITCSGRFNVRTNQYEQRVVVFTVQD